ncbi:septal ring lytic transglycosylase RlpA family protein [Phenylobacterium sp.]|uniref:septal ring lytic transglycosylase RlpA family protein n=1 Tax=Phenylobacterium sp. TaxID=1871053 RepID=UPI00281204C8|nr:septal ring lytic transglycosylase RlpA family protein [Phenylobacterium sp.]
MATAHAFRLITVLAAGASLAACASIEPRYASRPGASPPPAGAGGYKVGKPYQVGGVWYTPREQPDYDEVGIGSWYGDAFHMKATANGEIFDMNAVTAAHTTLPLPSVVEVTNLENGRKIQVRVNDRGPFVDNRIIDLSREAARQLGYDRKGLAKVRVRYVGPAPLLGREAGVRYASANAKVADDATLIDVAAGLPARPEPVTAQALPPIATAPAVAATPAAGGGLRIQAGAFASEGNAQRAVSQLSPAGPATIEPLQRADGVTLYRVVLPAPADEAEAYALRDRVAEIGFADARVVRPF